MKRKIIKSILSVIFFLTLITFILAEQTGVKFAILLIINAVIAVIIYFFSKFKKHEINMRDDFIENIDSYLEELESYGKESFKELKKGIANLRKEIESFAWNS